MEWIIGALVVAIWVGIAVWIFRYVRSVRQGDYRHPEETRRVRWVPGSGTHGGLGGQVPPLLPDHDPEDDIK